MKTVPYLLLTLSLIIILSSCGKKKEDLTAALEPIIENTPANTNIPLRMCNLEFLEDGTYLICDDGTIQKLSTDLVGAEGSSCTVTLNDDLSVVDCEDGTHIDVEVDLPNKTDNDSGEVPESGNNDFGTGRCIQECEHKKACKKKCIETNKNHLPEI